VLCSGVEVVMMNEQQDTADLTGSRVKRPQHPHHCERASGLEPGGRNEPEPSVSSHSRTTRRIAIAPPPPRPSGWP